MKTRQRFAVLLTVGLVGVPGCRPGTPTDNDPEAPVGDALEVAFYDDDYSGGYRVPLRDTAHVVVGGRALSVKEEADAIILEELQFLHVDTGLSVGSSAILNVAQNGNAIFNAVCGPLPFRKARGEWIQRPFKDYRAAPGELFVPIAEVRVATGQARFIEGLRIIYRSALDDARYYQDFIYRMRIGPKVQGRCHPDARKRG